MAVVSGERAAPAEGTSMLLPRPTSTFVGRDVELARAESLLAREVLCVVYGVPGIGKSELLYALSERVLQSPALGLQGAIILRCRSLRTGDALLSALVAQLGASERAAARGTARLS